MQPTDDFTQIYAECSNGYHKVDDFRGKLLGFLPLASGIGIFGALYVEIKQGSTNTIPGNYVALGVFGMLVTLGLLIYELKGIAKCTQFIFLGKWIESNMKVNQHCKTTYDNSEREAQGYFTELSGGRTVAEKVITEPVASAIIYSTVIAAWVYVIFLGSGPWKYILPPIVFVVLITLVYKYWRIVLKKITGNFEVLKRLPNAENTSQSVE
jgi:hypothetical protein